MCWYNITIDIFHTSVRFSAHLAGLFGVSCPLLAVAIALFWTLAGIGKLSAERAQAERRVTEIVNQPITHLPRSGPVALFSPGWFHSGAAKPDLNTVDVRATQEFPYSGYVSSDVNPAEMFIGSELEFNAMAKYFYVDRRYPRGSCPTQKWWRSAFFIGLSAGARMRQPHDGRRWPGWSWWDFASRSVCFC